MDSNLAQLVQELKVARLDAYAGLSELMKQRGLLPVSGY